LLYTEVEVQISNTPLIHLNNKFSQLDYLIKKTYHKSELWCAIQFNWTHKKNDNSIPPRKNYPRLQSQKVKEIGEPKFKHGQTKNINLTIN